MQQIMVHCFQAVKSKLECKLGYFDLIGCDFLVDENFKVLSSAPGSRGQVCAQVGLWELGSIGMTAVSCPGVAAGNERQPRATHQLPGPQGSHPGRGGRDLG